MVAYVWQATSETDVLCQHAVWTGDGEDYVLERHTEQAC
jgi:hypothetical protein